MLLTILQACGWHHCDIAVCLLDVLTKSDECECNVELTDLFLSPPIEHTLGSSFHCYVESYSNIFDAFMRYMKSKSSIGDGAAKVSVAKRIVSTISAQCMHEGKYYIYVYVDIHTYNTIIAEKHELYLLLF